MALSVAIVGITHWHAPRYLRMLSRRNVRWVGCSDVDAAAGARIAAGNGLAFHADTAEMLRATRPDFAVVIPRHDHATTEIATVAAHGVPMLVEKPMGRNAAEARASAAAMRAAGVFASVCLPNRYLAIWDAYRDLRDRDALGTLMHAHFRLINGPPARYLEYGVPWMLDPAISGGGALRNLGIHGADAIAMLAGERPLALAGGCTTSVGYRGAAEDFGTGVFTGADGFVASLEAGYTYAHMQEGGDIEWRIAAQGAYLQQWNGRLRIHRAGADIEERMTEIPSRAYDRMVDAALDAFEAGQPPPIPVEACVRAVELQDMIYAAGAPK